MTFPAFFDDVPGLTVYDPLAAFLGSTDDGLLHYRYADAVRLAGHSCPTVASAYWLARGAMLRLWGSGTPVRGQVAVRLRSTVETGTTGVVASVLTLLTGAAGSGGFAGIGGQFVRRALMEFGHAEQALELCFTRTDTGHCLLAQAHVQRVAADTRTADLMQQALAPQANPVLRREFAALWQERVRRLLLEHGDDPDVFHWAMTQENPA